MNEKNMTGQNTKPISKEDIQLYRLFCIFGAAILGFAAFRLVPYATFSKVLYPAGRFVALALLIAVAAGWVFIRFVKKTDESERIVTSTGVAYFLIPVLYLLFTFLWMDAPIMKCQVAFGFVSLFAAIYNIFKKEFRAISAVTFLTIMALYYASHDFQFAYEEILSVICKGLVFLIPAAMIVALLIPCCKKKTCALVTDKFGKLLTIGLSALLIVLALVTLILPAIFLYIMIAILAVYVVIGIVCTIRLI